MGPSEVRNFRQLIIRKPVTIDCKSHNSPGFFNFVGPYAFYVKDFNWYGTRNITTYIFFKYALGQILSFHSNNLPIFEIIPTELMQINRTQYEIRKCFQ